MSRKAYLVISGIIFGLVSLLHLARVVFGWEAVIGVWTVPFWVSWGGFVVAGILSAWAFCQTGKGSQ